ncbi:unnamed protein product [Mytilus coruscus]|uniref:EGF-like domain-containing protein n=1 Tax=Mytilus coruscus TaxID=42192 RepID=A0A6J7ZXY7_MYTCO|nr:unnamed protein product [Mytilus coruscus]
MICPENYCDDACVEMCDCPQNAYCDTLYCCLCKPGLHGVFCNETCTNGSYGPGCRKKCTCQTLEKCDPVTGNCTYNTSTIDLCPPGNQPQVTEAFKFIVIVVIIGGAMIIIIAFISCVISWSRDRNEQYIVGDVQTTETLGHYVDINPNDKISQEELGRLQGPFLPLPSYADDGIKPLQLVQRNSTIRGTNFTSAPTISHLCGAGKIYMYFSMPILSNKGKLEDRKNDLKKLKSRSCDHLTHTSLFITESDYLDPYCSLLRSGLTGSDYLNPYTTLLMATDEGINSTNLELFD